MYTDVLTGELIDPTGGGEDLKRRVLRATSKDPAVILRDDGLRIMRLARFAAELNFTPESATFEAAKAYSYLLKDISGERIQAELNKILLSDVKYPSMEREKTAPWDNAPFSGLSILSELGAYKYFVPQLERCRGVEQKAQYHAFDVLGHSLRVAACMPPRCICGWPAFSTTLASLSRLNKAAGCTIMISWESGFPGKYCRICAIQTTCATECCP